MNRYIDKFISYLQIEKNFSPHTITNYSLDLTEFMGFMENMAVDHIRYLHLRKYLAHLRTQQLKPRSIARKLSSLRSFFRFLQREGLIQENPAVLLITPKIDKTLPKFLSEKEMVALIEAPALEARAGR
ncbi:MAG: site-specific integrase [Candidatus Omnitrophica bacterium]|nr:site-specific integrase [Candidatus Omnitrophota bacterium]